MPGLYWRMTREGVTWELKFMVGGDLRSNTICHPGTEVPDRDMKSAIAVWRETKPDHDKKKIVLPKGNLYVADALDAFLADFEKKVGLGIKKQKTYVSYEGSARNHIAPYFEGTLLKSVDNDGLIEFVVHLRDKGLSQWTQTGIKNVLKQTFALALRKRWIVSDPFAYVDNDYMPKQHARPGHEPRLFRNDELAAMIEACPSLYRNMLIVMAFTGLRIGELCGLLWQDVDLEARTLSVNRQLLRESGGWTTGPPKGQASAATNLSYRTIELSESVYNALGAQETAEVVKGYRRPEDFVFTTSDFRGASGNPVSPDNYRKRGVQVAATEAGLGHVRPHDFRHTTASILAACRVPDTDAAAMMGHTVEVYWRVYAKAFADARARRTTMEALAAYGFGSIPETE